MRIKQVMMSSACGSCKLPFINSFVVTAALKLQRVGTDVVNKAFELDPNDENYEGQLEALKQEAKTLFEESGDGIK